MINDKVAVIGVHGVFPYASSLEAFDRVYTEKKDCMHDMDPKRVRLNGLDENKKYIQAGYLTDIDYFDYAFFGISKREAACIDPQHRLATEAACKAIESAGYSLSALRGTNTAVIVGAMDNYYRELFEDSTGFASTGTMIDTLPGRISYLLDLRGEASIVSTACSSSLYAIYGAYIKLLTGQCDMALAGGAYISFHAYEEGTFTEDPLTVGLASADGRCKAFEDSADGINTCESVAFIFMKRYEDAVRDNDHILAVIDGIGSNQDGARSNSFTSPSAAAQAELFERVWKTFGIDPEKIGYVEAHGTGTKIGDPIEISSITSAFRKFTDKKQFCPIGSLKSNYAHPGTSAGIASVIKAITSFQFNKKYPLRTLNTPNKMIDFKNSPVYPIGELEEWNEDKKIMAINSFGVSGTNVHMVLENYVPESDDDDEESDEFIVTVSAKNPQQIAEYKRLIKESIRADHKLSQICYVLNKGRDDYLYRDSAAIKDFEALRKFLDSEKEYAPAEKQKLVFICSGDARHEKEHIAQMRERYPVFRERFDVLSSNCHTDDALSAAADAAVMSQFESWGIKPDILIGTGLGNAAVRFYKDGTSDDAEEICDAAKKQPFAEDKFLAYMKNLSDSENGKIICVDVSGEGLLLKALKNSTVFRDALLIPGVENGSLLDALSILYANGEDVDWNSFYNGKTIRKILLATYPFLRTSAWPEVIISSKSKISDDTVEKEEDLKDFIRRIWMESLEVDAIGDDDDVFDLGANSLISMSILRKIKTRTGVEMDFEDLYDYCTVNELYEHLEKNAHEEKKSSMETVPRTEWMKVSGNQKRMLYIQSEAVNKAVYNMPILYSITGMLDERAFADTLKDIVERHEILHTIYAEHHGEFFQHVSNDYHFDVKVIDAEDMTEGEIFAMISNEAQRGFDLTNEIPIRIELIRKDQTHYYWFNNIHHIAADGWSLGIFYHEMEALYNGRVRENAVPLEPLPVQYVDYAYSESKFLESDGAKNEVTYWKKQLSGVSGILDFPIDKQRPEVKRYFGTVYRFNIDKDVTARAEKFTREKNISLFMLLESIYALLLYKYSGENDICVGVPIANRNSEEFEKIIGYFANTVVIRSRFDENATVGAFLDANKETILDAFSNSHVSFEEIVKNLSFTRKQSHSVLYQYAFTFQNYAYRDLMLDGVKIAPEFQQNPSVKFDLNFIVRRIDDHFYIEAEYDTDLFTESYIEEICGNYVKLLDDLLDHRKNIRDITLSGADSLLTSDDISDSLF